MNPVPDPIRSIAVISHPKVDQTQKEAQKIASFLNSKGIVTSIGFLYDGELRDRVCKKQFDLVITLGGDGTVLRAGHLCAPCNVPIFAINHGRFGFLIEVASHEWKRYLKKLLAGEYWLEKRMMLKTRVFRGEELVGDSEVLNEVVIGRGRSIRPVQLSAQLDGYHLSTYVADALIVATPTGSTAYALAAGGPVLPPEIRNILLLPVAPHLSIDRAIVLAEGSKINIELLSDHEAVFSADGQDAMDLHYGDKIEVYASEHQVQFVRFEEAEYFYRNLIALMDQNPSAGVVNK